MPRIQYVARKFSPASTKLIVKANEILEEYGRQGYILTLRQLFYQFVSRDVIPNTQKSYKNLGSVVNDARLAGLIDWDHLEDRTRNLKSLSTWDSPSSIIDACASQFKNDLWRDQPYRVEVWIEKDALAGVFERVCEELRVPYFSCRGYTSQSEMWTAAQRLQRYAKHAKQKPIILHFGDHDPSGLDMTRDIRDRLELFMGGLRLDRLALNMNQVEEYQPPPNPAKVTDSRAAGYIAEFGDESWELDALPPDVLAGLVRDAVGQFLDQGRWDSAKAAEARQRDLLQAVSDNWASVTEGL